MILCVEVIDCETYPAGAEYEHSGDDLADERDWLLEDVKDSNYCQNDTDDVDDL